MSGGWIAPHPALSQWERVQEPRRSVPSPAGCMDRRHGLQVFGDIGDTMMALDCSAEELIDALARGVCDGFAFGVFVSGGSGGGERIGPLPPVRDQPEDGVQVDRPCPVWRRHVGSVPTAARFAVADGRVDGSGGPVGAGGASTLGRPEDRATAAESGPDGCSVALDGDGNPTPSRRGAGRIGDGRAVPAVRAGSAERVVADGLQGPHRAGTGALPSADGAGRSFPFLTLSAGLCQRARRDGARASGGDVPPLRPAGVDHHRQRLALGRHGGSAVHTARCLAAAAWHRHQPQPPHASPDHGQGRTLPPEPEGRSPWRATLRRSDPLPAGLRPVAPGSTTPSGHTTPSAWPCPRAAMLSAQGSSPSSCRLSNTVPAMSSDGSSRAVGSTSGGTASDCQKPSPDTPLASSPPPQMATGRSSSQADASHRSICARLHSKLSSMSPNTCYPCPRSKHWERVRVRGVLSAAPFLGII